MRQTVGHDGLDRRVVEERDRRQSLFGAVVEFAVVFSISEVDLDVIDVVVFGSVKVVEKHWVDFKNECVGSFFDDFDLCHVSLQFVVVG